MSEEQATDTKSCLVFRGQVTDVSVVDGETVVMDKVWERYDNGYENENEHDLPLSENNATP